MGMQNTQASYPRVCTHEPQSFSTKLLEYKETSSEHLLQTRHSKPNFSLSYDCIPNYTLTDKDSRFLGY